MTMFKAELYHGDCLEVMASIPDQSVDLIAADLPYGTTALRWDSIIPLEPLWAHYKRVIKPKGAIVLTASQPFTTTLINSQPAWFKYNWVWIKSNAGDPFNAKNKPMKQHEDVLVFSEGTTANRSAKKMLYNPQGLRPYGKIKSNNGIKPGMAFVAPRPSHEESYIQGFEGYPTTVLKFKNDVGFHPTQKPVALFEYLIKTYSNPGETVLDNCAGAGTTGVAAINTGRYPILIEREQEYVEIARQRLEKALADRKEPVAEIYP